MPLYMSSYKNILHDLFVYGRYDGYTAGTAGI